MGVMAMAKAGEEKVKNNPFPIHLDKFLKDISTPSI
jgi:hypothetical protein